MESNFLGSVIYVYVYVAVFVFVNRLMMKDNNHFNFVFLIVHSLQIQFKGDSKSFVTLVPLTV